MTLYPPRYTPKRKRDSLATLTTLLVVLAVIIVVAAFHAAMAFLAIGLPMIIWNAPTWAWVGCMMVGAYASIGRGS